MPFSVREFHDLVQLLEQQPEWRAELRRLVLSDDLLAVPDLVRELAEAQRRTEQRVEELAEAQRRTEAGLGALQEQVRMLAETQQGLALTIVGLGDRIVTLVDVQQHVLDDVGHLKGESLELRYWRHAPAYFGRILRRGHVLTADERWELIDAAVERGQLSQAEADEVILTDLLVRGRRRTDQAEVYLVIEISWGIGHQDVERATERAALLARTGLQTIPVVAGSWAPDDVQQHARLSKVWQVTDGRTVSPAG